MHHRADAKRIGSGLRQVPAKLGIAAGKSKDDSSLRSAPRVPDDLLPQQARAQVQGLVRYQEAGKRLVNIVFFSE